MPTIFPAVISAGAVAAKESYNCFKPHFDYVYDLDNNYGKLSSESGDLSAMTKDTEAYIRLNENEMERTNRCENLLGKVRRIEGKIRDLEEQHENTVKFLCGMWPFLKLRKLGKDIVETTKEVVGLKAEMNKLMQHKNIMTKRRPEPVATKIVELNSQTTYVQELLKLLENEKVKRIGIWGIEGVGKTTLLKKLNTEAGQKDRFEIVLVVSYQGHDSVRKMQEDLLKQLKLDANGSDNTKELGDTISKKLKKKKYLLLLDQLITSDISLDEVGICSDHKYGKVVFASKDKKICKEMDANEFQIRCLPHEDARVLFKTIVGDVVKTHQRIQEIAELIVRELGGLPWIINGIATNLKNEVHESVWSSTLWTLQSPIESPQQHLQEVFNFFKHLYGQLHVDSRRRLLYAALFPRGYQIYDDYLVEGWKLQGLICDVQGDNGQPFRVARDRGHCFLEMLIDLCLLERCWGVKYITMPGQLRKLALKELYPKEEECQLLVEAGKQMGEEHPTEEKWRNAGRISLMCNRLHSLPKSPKCCKVSTLLLQSNKRLESIPKSFFSHMKKLQILDLCHTGIDSLPRSLFSLIDLRGLYLIDCHRLAVLSSQIAKLQNLEILDIRDTDIFSLPIEIGQLRKLKCFRVSFRYNDAIADNPKYNTLCFRRHKRRRVMIPPNLIKKLQQLEELTIIVDPREQSWVGIVDTIAKEVATLKLLTTLCFNFPSEGSLDAFIQSWSVKAFRSYKLCVGNHGGSNSYVGSTERLLRYFAGTDITSAIREVLKQATTFEFIGHCSAKSLSDFGLENMKSLEVCVIRECKEMTSIWREPVVPESLAKLRTLTLNGCPKLTKILSHGIAQQLQQLQCLRVENCSEITEIIEAENRSVENCFGITEIIEVENPSSQITENNLSRALPMLESLELVNLPSLVSICESDRLGWIALKKIKIEQCTALIKLSLTTENARQLSSISCDEDWWKELQLLQVGLKKHLESFCIFNLEESPSGYETPPEASPSVNGHRIVHNQLLDDDMPLANHNLGESHAAFSSNSIAARPLLPSDPSSSNWDSPMTHDPLAVGKKFQLTDPSALSPAIMTINDNPKATKTQDIWRERRDHRVAGDLSPRSSPTIH